MRRSSLESSLLSQCDAPLPMEDAALPNVNAREALGVMVAKAKNGFIV